MERNLEKVRKSYNYAPEEMSGFLQNVSRSSSARHHTSSSPDLGRLVGIVGGFRTAVAQRRRHRKQHSLGAFSVKNPMLVWEK